jgi:hypothetical protein
MDDDEGEGGEGGDVPVVGAILLDPMAGAYIIGA